MENGTDAEPPASRRIPFAETASGMLAGLWIVPTAGFGWRDDLVTFASRINPEVLTDKGPWLVALGDRGRRYALLRRPGLLAAIDRLAAAPTAAHVLQFANRWGALGVEARLVRDAGGGSAALESGESLAAWHRELFALGDLRMLFQAVKTLDGRDQWGHGKVRVAEGHIADRIRWSPDGWCSYSSRFGTSEGWASWSEHFIDPTQESNDVVAQRLAGHNSLEAARYYLHRRVNRALRGNVSPSVLPFMDGAVRFFPHSLLSAVWLRFALDLAGRYGREKECEYCRVPFVQGRRDQRFCGKNCQEASAYRRRQERSTAP